MSWDLDRWTIDFPSKFDMLVLSVYGFAGYLAVIR